MCGYHHIIEGYNMVTDYLSDLFPRSVETPEYNLRQQNEFLTLPRRTYFKVCHLSRIGTLYLDHFYNMTTFTD